MIHFTFKKNVRKLYELLPVLDRNGQKIRVTMNQFQHFIDIILTYLDFKQKEKFGKLKKLRQTQSQLPVTEYRYVITAKSNMEQRIF